MNEQKDDLIALITYSHDINIPVSCIFQSPTKKAININEGQLEQVAKKTMLKRKQKAESVKERKDNYLV